MFCCKQDYLKVEKINYKTLKIVDKECYKELLISNNDFSIHQKQLHTLTTRRFTKA